MKQLRDLFYDWEGGNVALFRAINNFRPGETYDAVMLTITRQADYHRFPYYFVGLVMFALVSYFWRKLRRRGGGRQYLISWAGIFLVMAAGFALYGGTVIYLKNYYAFPRPYVALDSVHLLNDKADAQSDYRSLPSGHAAFITFLVASLWPMLYGGWRWFAAALIPLVMWTRISLGMHFPADVIAGFLIPLIEIPLLRYILYFLLRKLFGLKC